jgi:hypothetical protein
MMYRLVKTCGACPEQYDVFLGTEQVGYLRLRHGYFRADYPGCGHETVYEAHTRGDGCFNDDEERDLHLTRAIEAIDKKVRNRITPVPLYTIEGEE